MDTIETFLDNMFAPYPTTPRLIEALVPVEVGHLQQQRGPFPSQLCTHAFMLSKRDYRISCSGNDSFGEGVSVAPSI